MKKWTRLSGAVVAGCAVVAGAAAVASFASAGGAADPTVTVVAQNLGNPRGLWAAADGSIYVASAGNAGPTKIDKQTFLGFTSSIVRWRPSGATMTLSSGVRGLSHCGHVNASAIAASRSGSRRWAERITATHPGGAGR